MVSVCAVAPLGTVTEVGSAALTKSPLWVALTMTSSALARLSDRVTRNSAALPSVTGEETAAIETVGLPSSRTVTLIGGTVVALWLAR